MRTDGAELTETDTNDASGLSVERLESIAQTRDRGFWTGLAIATALHAFLLIGIGRAIPRQVGDDLGSTDGIAINVVSEAELRGDATVAEAPAPPPGTPQPASDAKPPPPPPQFKPTQQEDALPQPADTKSADADQNSDPAPSEPAVEEKPVAAPAEKALETALEKDIPDLLALKKPAKEAKETPPPQPKKPASVAKPMQQPTQSPPQKVAKLDLTPPSPAFSGSAGGAGRRAGLERPPGITRSGANDQFARDVVRALQQTMPQLREVLGRVTVRITLNENGNVSDVQIVRAANNAQIDQSVVFAARQTSYPFPPPNSNLADRTFLITYIYH